MKFIPFFILLIIFNNVIAQEEPSDLVEVFIIDSYVTPEKPNKFILTFFTYDTYKTEIQIDFKDIFNVSDSLAEDHKFELNLSDQAFDSLSVPFIILLSDENGKQFKSEVFYFELPSDQYFSKMIDPTILSMCIGGLVYLLPSPGLVIMGKQNYYTITKELPVITFYSQGRNYPSSYIGIEYSHILKAPKKNFLRLGYKHIYEIPVGEYIAPGINVFTDFLGFNGISPEISWGLFKTGQIFTLYARYRFNFQPSNSSYNFHEISIGLFSHFFSLNF